MATYAISFSLKYDSDYSERYESFMEEVRKCPTVWEETTSFALVDSSDSLTSLERRLFLTKFSPTKDLMLVINVNRDDAIARGKIEEKTKLKRLLPDVEIK